jgi:hypothetical protein
MAMSSPRVTPGGTEAGRPAWSEVRFGVLVLQDADYSILRER